MDKDALAKIEAAGTPGAAHKSLDNFAGDWKAEVQCWMKPDGPPTVSKARAKARWIMNGRFIEEEFVGEVGGKPFNGRFLIGFDNTKQMFNSVWVDDMHTSMCFAEGKGDVGYHVFTLEGTTDCPVSGRKDISMKQIFRIISHDRHVLEMFNDDVKSMEITYVRQ